MKKAGMFVLKFVVPPVVAFGAGVVLLANSDKDSVVGKIAAKLKFG